MTGSAATTVEISEQAAREARRLRAKEGHPEQAALRLAVRGGGCSGFSYDLSFVTETRPDDLVVEREGMRFLIDPKSLKFLSGMILDWSGGLMGQGFVFRNPNARASCGCGKSFAV